MDPLKAYLVVNRHRRRPAARREALAHGAQRAGLGCGAVVLLALAAGVILAGAAYARLTAGLPSPAAIAARLEPPDGLYLQPTRLYDRSGQHLLLEIGNPGVARRYLPLVGEDEERLSPALARVTVAALDPSFATNPGFSPDPARRKLAQRLAGSLLLETEPAGLRRDLREGLLAAQLTAAYGRDQVLEWYLNSAYYGHLAYGAEAAAQAYLGKPASRLDLAEAALLVAVSQAPALNPLDAPEAALAGQRHLLAQLLAEGTITRAEFDRASAEVLALRAAPAAPDSPAPAFTALAIDQLAARFGRERVERGGLRVITTLDYGLQQQVACAARTQLLRAAGQGDEVRTTAGGACEAARLLPTLPGRPAGAAPELAAAAEILDPHSGQILALVGEAGQPRSPGSLITPFVYLAGFTRGMGPASLVWDIPANLPADAGGEPNPDGSFHGPQRARMALANDYLAPAAGLLAQIGPPTVWQLAGQLGISGLEAAGDDVVYDGGALRLTAAAQAYGVLATGGTLTGQPVDPAAVSDPTARLASTALLAVEAVDGRSWPEVETPVTRAVLSPQLAYLVNHVLSDETARWPSLGYPNALEIGRPAGAKLGQTTSGQDAWAVGYTPQLVAAAWVGSPHAAAGAARVDPRLAAGLWHALIQYATHDLPAQGWSAPPGISTLAVCDPSGLLPTAACPNVVSEVFQDGTQPAGVDTLYRAYQVNRETGRLATVFTPPELMDQRVYLIVPPAAQAWAAAEGLPAPPRDYDAIQAPPRLPGAQITTPGMFADVRGKVVLTGTASGADFEYYRVQVGQGINPQSWVQVGPDGRAAVDAGKLAEWDTAGLNGLYAVRLLVVSRDQRVQTATIQVTVDNQPPQVRAVYPVEGQRLAAPAGRAIALQAEADDDIGLARVELFVDGKLVAALTAPPYSFPWQGAAGEHTFSVSAYDRAGNAATAGPVKFTLTP